MLNRYTTPTYQISIHLPRVGQDMAAILYRYAQHKFQSTCPVWGRTIDKFQYSPDDVISIHLPRVGQDWGYAWTRAEYHQFQSTCPVWGRTA